MKTLLRRLRARGDLAFAYALDHLHKRVYRSPKLSPAVKGLMLTHLTFLADARIVGLLPDPPAAPPPKPPRRRRRA